MRLRLAIVVLLVAVASPAAAHASVLAFTCGPGYANLCESAPDGSSLTKLTTDATRTGTDVYASPSLSSDGTKLAFLHRGQLFVLDARSGKIAGPAGGPGAFLLARMRPDGQKVLVGEFAGFNGSSDCIYDADTTGRQCVGGNSGSLGWAAGGDVFLDFSNTATSGRRAICVASAAPGATSGCVKTVLFDPGADLSDPVLSPDGSVIAVTRSAPGALAGQIAEYDAASGQLVDIVSAGPGDSGPVFAPDSSAIAFDRAGAGVMTVSPVAKGPGSEKLVVPGARDVTWGGGSISAPAKGRCTVPSVTGKHLSAAKAALKKAGCGAPSVSGSKRSSAVVKTQSPKGGRTLSSGSVKLTTRG